MKDSAVNFIVIASSFATLKMKPNVNPAKVIIEKDRIRIMNTLFNLKLQAPDKEVAALLKRKPPYISRETVSLNSRFGKTTL